MELLRRWFGESLEPLKKGKGLTDEELVELGESVKIFLKSNLIWNKVLEPFLEETAMSAMSNMINNGLKLNNEEKNQVITSVSLALSVRNELKKVEDEGRLAKERLERPRGGGKLGYPRKRT